MLKKIVVLCAGLSANLALLTPAYSIESLNFQENYALALTRDPQLQSAYFQLRSVAENKPQARAALLPQVGLSASRSRSRQQIDGSGVFFNGTTYFENDGYSLSINQTLYNRQQLLTLDLSDIEYSQAKADYQVAEADLIVRLADAYFNVLAAKDNFRFLKLEEIAINKQREQTLKRFEVGLIAITDVKEAQAQYDSAIAASIEGENQLNNAEESLLLITAEPFISLSSLQSSLDWGLPEPNDINAWVTLAKRDNPSLLSANFAREVARKQVDINRAAHYPTVDLVASHNFSGTSGGGTFGASDQETSRIEVQVNVPIYSGGLTSSRTRQAALQYNQARFALSAQERSVVQLVRSSYLNVNAALIRIKALKEVLASSKAAVEATEDGYDAGTRTVIEVLASLRNQYRAERDYAQARYDYILNWLRLKQAAGTINNQDVITVNEWLEED